MRTQHAILFRLSNKTVQVKFEDNTEIVLCSETRGVDYVDKKGVRKTCSLSTIIDLEDNVMVKRFKYAKDLLTHIFGAKQTKQSSRIFGFTFIGENIPQRVHRLILRNKKLVT